MQEGCGMKHLDSQGELRQRFDRSAANAADVEDQHRPDALASRLDEVQKLAFRPGRSTRKR